MSKSFPARGEVWLIDLNPIQGREQAGIRPAVVISADGFNSSLAELVIVIPITSRKKGTRLHVKINPPEGGIITESYIKCEDIRSVSVSRLKKKLGSVGTLVLHEIETRLRLLLGLAT